MDFREYRDQVFPGDLTTFLGGMPEFGYQWQFAPHRAPPDRCVALTRVPQSNRAAFLICLYHLVLMDQLLHAHFPDVHRAAASLQRFPKFCLAPGRHHRDPHRILNVPVVDGVVDRDALCRLLPEGMRLFVEYATGFLSQHAPGVSPQAFFLELMRDDDVESAPRMALFGAGLANQTGTDAYFALIDALDQQGIDWRAGPPTGLRIIARQLLDQAQAKDHNT